NTARAGDNAEGFTSSGQSDGGAILNSRGSVAVTHCTFTGNIAKGGDNGNNDNPDEVGVGFALGGAILSLRNCTLTVSDSTFSGNQAIAGNNSAGPGAQAEGGGIDSDESSTLTVSNTAFSLNVARGGLGGPGFEGGIGFGGAIANQFNSIATFTNTTFTGNQAVGGPGGAGAKGGTGAGGAIGNG